MTVVSFDNTHVASEIAAKGAPMGNRAALFLALFVLSFITPSAPAVGQNNPPQDKPVRTNAENLKKFEDAIAPYVKKARETLPEAKKKYLAGLPKNQTFFVTVKLYDSFKKFEQVFVRVTSWKGESIQGILASDPGLIDGHKRGDKLNCNESDILDWTISKPDGTEEGNFVGKFLDTYQP